MKNFEFEISTEISVLSFPEPILTVFGIVCVCVCVCADVRIPITQKRLVVKC
ncbi:hypothetical protein O3M35_011773 [Rhynocoris fuscipes]|uniref:Uncharacterized protein n=1 Tax=Rhynocoris fuscipes TaxID=488301 RepID=A0AAW1D484_9HEMI